MNHDHVANHEAAHCAMAMVLGADVYAVNTVGDGMPYAGWVTHAVDGYSSRRSAVERICVILAGLFEERHWDELKWGSLNPSRSTDEAELVRIVEAWSIEPKLYNEIGRLALRLSASDKFYKWQSYITGALDFWPILDRRLLIELVRAKEAADAE